MKNFKYITTVLSSDPFDVEPSTDEVWIPNQDWKKLSKLSPGTKIYIESGDSQEKLDQLVKYIKESDASELQQMTILAMLIELEDEINKED